MLVVYDSLTGNVQRFIEKLELPAIKISENLLINEPFVLITYTTGFGKIPKSVVNFLEANNPLMYGVISSGNRNWGDKFGRAADLISELYCAPILAKFELSGTEEDVKFIKERINAL